MEPFRITCETCHSRLKIRSAEAIGQIHACPKCGSMVLIAPPGLPGPLGSTTLTAVADLSGSTEPLVSVSTSPSTMVPADFAFDLPAPTIAARAPDPADHVNFEPRAELSAAPRSVATGISLVVWCAIVGGALFVVAGLAFVFWPTGETRVAKTVPPIAAVDAAASVERSPEVSEPNEDPRAAAVDPDAGDGSKPVENEAAEAPAPPPAPVAAANVAAVSSDQQAPTDPAPATPPNAEPAAVEIKPASPASPVATTAEPIPSESVKRADAATPNANATTANHVLKFDPLDFDPAHLSLSSPPTPTAGSAAPSTNSIPPGAAADPALAASNGTPDNEPNATDLLPPPMMNQAVNVRRGPAATDEARPIDAPQRLAFSVKSLRLPEMPFKRFIETVSDMAGVPITLDPVTLELNGNSLETPVSFEVADSTLDKVLRDALAKQRLELIDQNGRVHVAIPNAAERKRVDFDVNDLSTSGDAATIAQLIERFVAPKTWQAAGGSGTIEVDGATLHIDNTLLARREALIFCEQLRLARRLAPRSKYPVAMLSIDSPQEKLAASLSKRTTFTFLPWTRLAEVLRHWQELTGLTILVDWNALGDVGLGPSSQIACSANDRPWSEVFDGVLEPLGLAWWGVDANTVQITSIDARKAIERVEFHTVPAKLRQSFPTGIALVETLSREISERSDETGRPAEFRATLDEPSGRLIVRAAPDAHHVISERFRAR